MNSDNIWMKSQQMRIETTECMSGDFDIGFDERIPEETREELRCFVRWVESRFLVPVTLWVDFEYKHYLIGRDGKRAGYLFYWADFADYPRFDREGDLPQIRLPVRTEHSTMEEILVSFIEAITCYYAWISNLLTDDYLPGERDVEEVLQAYRESKGEFP